MLENPLPQWVRDQCQEHIDGYLKAAQLCRGRMRVLAAIFPKKRGFLPEDDGGTYEDYRLDAVYCEGQAERMKTYLTLRDAGARVRPPVEQQDSREHGTKEILKSPDWPEWNRPWRKLDPIPLPEPMDALKIAKPQATMDKFTPKEAEALILCYTLEMKPKEAADIMECSPRQVTKFLQSARHKFGPNEENIIRLR